MGRIHYFVCHAAARESNLVLRVERTNLRLGRKKKEACRYTTAFFSVASECGIPLHNSSFTVTGRTRVPNLGSNLRERGCGIGA